MAHCIERKKDGSYSMAWAGETPWHGLGKEVPADLTATQMLEAAQLDWSVSKTPLKMKNKDGKYITTEMTALIRDSDEQILDYVPDSWNPLQNAEAFGFFHDFVMAGDMEMHTAGSLHDGAVVWALAKIKNSFSVFGKDQVDNYLLFSNPHKFGKAIDVRTTSIRVVCNNTITMALSAGSSNQIAKISHRREFDPAIVKATLGIVTEKHSKLKDASEFLATKMYNEDTLAEFMTKIFPGNTKKEMSRNAAKAIGIIDMQPGADLFPKTWYNALQAVTFLTTHDMGYKQDSKLYNQWFGSTQRTGIEALNEALEFAKTA